MVGVIYSVVAIVHIGSIESTSTLGLAEEVLRHICPVCASIIQVFSYSKYRTSEGIRSLNLATKEGWTWVSHCVLVTPTVDGAHDTAHTEVQLVF